MSGFIRFLKFISEHKWAKSPLVINVKEGFSSVQMAALMEPFSSSVNRQTELPAMVIRLPSNVIGDHWTSQGPNEDTLNSIKVLAKRTLCSLKHLLDTNEDLTPLFVVDKTNCDVIFNLRSSIVNLLLDKCVSVTPKEIHTCKNDRLDKKFPRKYRFWPNDYEDNPIEVMIEWIRVID